MISTGCKAEAEKESATTKSMRKRALWRRFGAVTPEDDVIMITDDGIIIRIHSDDVTLQSRYGSGVRVMRVPEGGRVVTLARVPKEEESETTEMERKQTAKKRNPCCGGSFLPGHRRKTDPGSPGFC